MALMTRIEEIISIPLELFHNRKGFHPVDLNRLALRCMEQDSRKGIKKTYAPNRFRVLLNPDDYKDLYPFLDTIRSDISGELRRVVEERNYLLAGDLIVEIEADRNIDEGLPQVKAHMHGSREPYTVVSLNDKNDNSEQTAYSPVPDGKTVIVLPGSKETLGVPLQEGITMLREGRAEEAHSVLSSVQDDLKDSPIFQAAMAVALEMIDKRFEALEHYNRIETLDGPKPEVQRRIEWIKKNKSTIRQEHGATEIHGVLELSVPGVSIQFGKNGVSLKNKNLDQRVQVDGRVESRILLKDGASFSIGEVTMTYRSL